MRAIEIIGFAIAVAPLLGGFYAYVRSESQKARERRAALLNEYREKIQMNPSIAGVMYQCETKTLTTDFFRKHEESTEDDSKKKNPKKDSPENQTYIDVVATLGFFDALCYTFFTKNLGKDEFVYFWGEMKEITDNESIQEYLLFLEGRNFKSEEKTFSTINDLIDQIYPYCFLQIFSHISLKDMNSFSRSAIMRAYWAASKSINEDLKDKYQKPSLPKTD